MIKALNITDLPKIVKIGRKKYTFFTLKPTIWILDILCPDGLRKMS
jgi:hypothetical protein